VPDVLVVLHDGSCLLVRWLRASGLRNLAPGVFSESADWRSAPFPVPLREGYAASASGLSLVLCLLGARVVTRLDSAAQ
jgi:hypothetical protein